MKICSLGTPNAEVHQLRQRSALLVPPMASQSADTGGDRNQDHPLRSSVPSIRGKANRHPSARVFGSHLVLDEGRSRKQAARFQDPLQQPSHAYLTGRANAGYARVTTNCQSPLVSMATTLSGPLSDTGGCLISQRFVLAAASGRPLQKPRMKSSGVRFLSCSAFRGSDQFARGRQGCYIPVGPMLLVVSPNGETTSFGEHSLTSDLTRTPVH